MSKRVLLISPPEKQTLMEAGDRPNLGLLYLAGALKKNNHNVVISDLNHDSYKSLNNKIDLLEPEYIGITTTTPYFNWFSNFVEHLRYNYPKVKYIAGGPHATADPESLVDKFDYVVKGEGERAINYIIEKEPSEKIIDMGYERDLDSLEKPARDIIPMSRYGINQEGYRTATILTSRSCNYNCFFCTKNILGSKQRTHSIDRVLDEIDELKEKYGFNSFYFLDDCFSYDMDRAKELTEKMIGKDITYRVATRVNKIDDELMSLFKKSGIRSISFGLEHMDTKILENINKGNTLEDNIRGIKLAKKHNIKIRGSFILNLPGATRETINKTYNLAERYNLDFADFYPLIAYPGTPLWNSPDRFKVEITNKNYDFYQTSGKTNVRTEQLEPEETEKILKEIKSKWFKFKGTQVPWELK